ncbi:hypothetical protein AB0N29_14815 [Nocardioides sp. NPDC092400]|uniref:TetR/AcrR family transcriptional regulator n=1 Tax=Nocardioides sp. NPDC092400 TaxID=3155196 RepID=UPI003419F291
MTSPARKRDPVGRRRAIVEAAVELLLEGDGAELTHRRVAARAGVPLGSTTQYFATLADLRTAALEQIAAANEAGLVEIREALAAPDSGPDTLAALLHRYIADEERLRADNALWAAALRDAELHRLVRHWYDGFTAVLRDHVSPPAAVALAVYLDGAAMHASFHDEPLDLASLAAVIAALSTVEGGEA